MPNEFKIRNGLVVEGGSTIITGSLTATGGITGSLLGTASFASTASFVTSASFATTASFVTSASFATTASFVPNTFIQGGNSFGAQALLGTNDTQDLALETSGSVRMFISSSGNIGVGTLTPTNQFTVKNLATTTANRATILIDADGTIDRSAQLIFSQNNLNWQSILATHTSAGGVNYGLQLNDGGTITFVTNKGRMFIGNSFTLPSSSLHVRGEGTTSSTTAFLIQNSNAISLLRIADNGLTNISGSLAVSASNFDMFNNSAAYGGFTLNSNATSTAYVGAQSVFGQVKADVTNSSVWFGTTTGGAITRLGHSGSAGGATYLNFSTNGANTGLHITHNGGSDLMTVTSAGNVGIGIDVPTARLHISGTSASTLFEIDSPALNNIIFVSGSGRVGIGTGTPTSILDVSGSGRFTNGLTVTGSLNVTAGITGSLLGTASFATLAQTANTASFVLNAVSASYVLQAVSASFATLAQTANTASFVLNAVSSSFATQAISSSFASTASFVNTLNQNVLITGSLTIGSSSIGASENTLILGIPPAGGTGEGGQLLLQASGGLWTSASMLDNFQNQFRILRGTNAGSDAVLANFNTHTRQVQFPSYNSVSAFAGTAVANLAVDSNGNILTVSTSGGSVFPFTGIATINGGLIVTGSITASSAIHAQANGAMYFRGGDDAELWDINVVNTLGVYGQQDATVASIKLGSGGGTISGRSNNIGIGTITPTSASLTVNGNIWATSLTGSLLGTASFATLAQTANTASFVLQAVSASFATLAQTANTASFVQTAQTASFVLNAVSASFATSASRAVSSSFATTASFALNAGTGTVTQIDTAGNVNGITLTGGPITTLGTITLGGALTDIQNNQLASSSLRIGTTSISLGTTSSLLSGLTSLSSTSITASIISASSGITGSLLGTASFATSASQAVSSSFALTASFALNAGGGGATFNGGTNVDNRLITATGTTPELNGEANLTFNGSTLVVTGNVTATSITSSFTGSLVGALTGTASFAASASQAITASFVPNTFIQNGNSFGAQAVLGTNDTQNLALETNGTNRLFISSSGRVGIGTTTPRQQFEVNGAIMTRTADPVFIMEDTSNVDNNAFYMGAFFDTGFPISYGSLAINRNPATGVFRNTARAASQINFESSASFSMVRFYTANTNNTTPDLAISITPLRNMIVGSSAVGNEASARLHVRGSGATSATNTLLIQNSTPTNILTIRDDGQTSINGNTSVTGSFTVATGSNVELEVLGTGVRLGNVIGDAHTVTGSFSVSGSGTFAGNIIATGSFTVNGQVRVNNQTGGTPGAFNTSAGVVNNYWGVADGDFLSTPTIWLSINLDGTTYYIPSYQ